jgi:putative nucleotidyltransferase with HDIG domain
MQQRVKRQDLRPGMYVVSYGQGSFDDPVVKVEKPILTPEDVVRLVPETVEDAVVDTQVHISLLGQERPAGVPITTGLADELPIAKRLYSEALDHVKSFVEEVRRGTDIDVRKAEPLVQNFIESVFRNESAAVTLFKLRGFDEYTYTHSINVSLLAVLLGKHLGLDKAILLNLGLAGMYHDVGKARIPEAILNKPGKLTEAEFNVMKTHPLEGYRLLAGKKDLDPEILRAVVEHHERHDGSGYPRGLRGESLGLFSRVIGIVDVYDALTSRRVYKEPMAPSKALSMMYQWRDRDFPPQAVENFIRCVGVFPLGSFVRLSNGEYGIVASSNPLAATRPEVKVVLDAKMRPQVPRVADLETLSGTPEALDIVEVLNPADYKIDLERFLMA